MLTKDNFRISGSLKKPSLDQAITISNLWELVFADFNFLSIDPVGSQKAMLVTF